MSESPSKKRNKKSGEENESVKNENTSPNKPSKVVRMWHQKKGEWCHAWDVEDVAYRAWKKGLGPLSRFAVYLPDGEHPRETSQVVCGTCGEHRLVPLEMKQEFIRL